MKVELVTDLKRQAIKILADLHESKEVVLITGYRQPSAHLVDVRDYEFMRVGWHCSMHCPKVNEPFWRKEP